MVTVSFLFSNLHIQSNQAKDSGWLIMAPDFPFCECLSSIGRCSIQLVWSGGGCDHRNLYLDSYAFTRASMGMRVCLAAPLWLVDSEVFIFLLEILIWSNWHMTVNRMTLYFIMKQGSQLSMDQGRWPSWQATLLLSNRLRLSGGGHSIILNGVVGQRWWYVKRIVALIAAMILWGSTGGVTVRCQAPHLKITLTNIYLGSAKIFHFDHLGISRIQSRLKFITVDSLSLVQISVIVWTITNLIDSWINVIIIITVVIDFELWLFRAHLITVFIKLAKHRLVEQVELGLEFLVTHSHVVIVEGKELSL